MIMCNFVPTYTCRIFKYFISVCSKVYFQAPTNNWSSISYDSLIRLIENKRIFPMLIL